MAKRKRRLGRSSDSEADAGTQPGKEDVEADVTDASTAGEPSEQPTAAEEEFVRGVLVRGEAAHAEDGELESDATHEIVEERKGALPKIRRRRFKAF